MREDDAWRQEALDEIHIVREQTNYILSQLRSLFRSRAAAEIKVRIDRLLSLAAELEANTRDLMKRFGRKKIVEGYTLFGKLDIRASGLITHLERAKNIRIITPVGRERYRGEIGEARERVDRILDSCDKIEEAIKESVRLPYMTTQATRGRTKKVVQREQILEGERKEVRDVLEYLINRIEDVQEAIVGIELPSLTPSKIVLYKNGFNVDLRSLGTGIARLNTLRIQYNLNIARETARLQIVVANLGTQIFAFLDAGPLQQGLPRKVAMEPTEVMIEVIENIAQKLDIQLKKEAA